MASGTDVLLSYVDGSGNVSKRPVASCSGVSNVCLDVSGGTAVGSCERLPSGDIYVQSRGAAASSDERASNVLVSDEHVSPAKDSRSATVCSLDSESLALTHKVVRDREALKAAGVFASMAGASASELKVDIQKHVDVLVDVLVDQGLRSMTDLRLAFSPTRWKLEVQEFCAAQMIHEAECVLLHMVEGIIGLSAEQIVVPKEFKISLKRKMLHGAVVLDIEESVPVKRIVLPALSSSLPSSSSSLRAQVDATAECLSAGTGTSVVVADKPKFSLAGKHMVAKEKAMAKGMSSSRAAYAYTY